MEREARHLFQGELDLLGGAVVLASYPRSGNSLARDVCERITGVVTGSDVRPDRKLSRALHSFGLRGEGVVDETVLIVKTHYPERLGYAPLSARRIVLLVRNPLDALVSYFNMMCTMSHTTTIAKDEYDRFGAEWRSFVAEEIEMWHRFNSWWIERSMDLNVPLVVVRYEDVVRDRSAVARTLIDFLLPESSGAGDGEAADGGAVTSLPPLASLGSSGAMRRQRIRSCWVARACALYIAPEPAAPTSKEGAVADAAHAPQIGVYQPRTGKVRINASRDHYSEEQLAAMRANIPLHAQLERFGYAASIAPQPPSASVTPPAAPPAALGHSGGAARGAVSFNDGEGFRPRTREDPHARGFPWKKRVAKDIRTVPPTGAASAAAAAFADECSALEGGTMGAMGHRFEIVRAKVKALDGGAFAVALWMRTCDACSTAQFRVEPSAGVDGALAITLRGAKALDLPLASDAPPEYNVAVHPAPC